MSEFMGLMERMDTGWEGYQPLGRVQVSEAALARTVELLYNTSNMPSHRNEYLLREAVSTSDFPTLLGLVLDRELMARYKAVIPDWRAYCGVGTLRDFNQGRKEKMQGNDTRLAVVPELTEYPIVPMATANYVRQLRKYGRSFGISWEALINDFLGAFGDLPARFTDAAIMTEAWEVTSLYCGAAAPNAGLYGAPIVDVDGQAVTNLGILPLTIQNLEITVSLMARQTDVNGRPLGIRAVHLVVPPALEWTARAILTSAFQQQVDTAGGANAVVPTYIPLPTTNIVPQMGLQLKVDPLIPQVMPVAAANRTWFLFADRGKAIQLDFLRGHETPEVCMKASNKVTLSGQNMAAAEGSFEDDMVTYRVRHCLGGAQFDPRYTYAQVGP